MNRIFHGFRFHLETGNIIALNYPVYPVDPVKLKIKIESNHFSFEKE